MVEPKNNDAEKLFLKPLFQIHCHPQNGRLSKDNFKIISFTTLELNGG